MSALHLPLSGVSDSFGNVVRSCALELDCFATDELPGDEQLPTQTSKSTTAMLKTQHGFLRFPPHLNRATDTIRRSITVQSQSSRALGVPVEARIFC